MQGKVLQDLLRRFVVLEEFRNKYVCLVHDMLWFTRQLKLNLNVQSDSIPARVKCVILALLNMLI